MSQSNSLQSDIALQPQLSGHQQQHAEPARHDDEADDLVEPSIRDELDAGQIQTTSVEDILETEEDLVDAVEEASATEITPRGAPASRVAGTLALA